MKIKAAISILLTLMMAVSAFTVATANPCPEGSVVFTKKVWDSVEELWVEEIDASIGDTVRFNITMTYYKHPDNPYNWKLYEIEVWDVLPECLVFDNEVMVSSPGNPIDYTEETAGNKIFWNFTSPMLDDGESLYIEFNATVVESEETDNQNWAYYNANECGEYLHCGGDDAWVHVVIPPEPGVNIDKKIWDGEEWVDEYATYLCVWQLIEDGQYLDFQITVTNTGNVDLNNVVVTDVLPPFLTYYDSDPSPSVVNDGEIIWYFDIPVDGVVVINLTTEIIGEYFIFNDVAEGDNYVNVTDTEYEVFAWDSVHILLSKRLEVEKEVYDSDSQEWVNEINQVQIGETIKFRITTTYHGPSDSRMVCGIIGDLLPDYCLEYLETTLVKVAGVTIGEGTYQYPDIIPDHGNTLTLCGEEVEIPTLVPSPFPGADWYIIIWDFRDAWDFELHDGESVVIEFETEVTQYCECISTNIALGLGWSCYCCDECNYYVDWDYANVTCSPPDTSFEKKVWDGEGWSDEGSGIVGETMKFRLRFEYYGNENLTDVRIVDELPCVLVFDEVKKMQKINTSVEVSENGKTIWFNMSEWEISDGDVVIIEFTALVTGATGDCCPAYNKAWLYIYEDCEIFDWYYDEVQVTTHQNYKPCPTIIRDPTDGVTEEELTFYVKSYDVNGDKVYYMIDWGDETTSGWIGPYTSGVEITVEHTWEEVGNYTVVAKAKDTHDEIGEWGNTITVEIEQAPPEPPEKPDVEISFKRFGMKSVTAIVTNNLEVNLTNCQWNMTVKGGLLGRIDVFINGTTNLTPGAKTITAGWGGLLGNIGRITAVVKVLPEGYTEPFNATASGFAIGRFVLIR